MVLSALCPVYQWPYSMASVAMANMHAPMQPKPMLLNTVPVTRTVIFSGLEIRNSCPTVEIAMVILSIVLFSIFFVSQ